MADLPEETVTFFFTVGLKKPIEMAILYILTCKKVPLNSRKITVEQTCLGLHYVALFS